MLAPCATEAASGTSSSPSEGGRIGCALNEGAPPEDAAIEVVPDAGCATAAAGTLACRSATGSGEATGAMPAEGCAAATTGMAVWRLTAVVGVATDAAVAGAPFPTVTDSCDAPAGAGVCRPRA